MNIDIDPAKLARAELSSERAFLLDRLAECPCNAVLTRMSLHARLDKLDRIESDRVLGDALDAVSVLPAPPASPIRISIARGLHTRRRGLLGQDGIEPGLDGLLILRCPAIHMIGMRFAIDAVFLHGRRGLDGREVFEIVRICRDVAPGVRTRAARISAYFIPMRGIHVLEMAAGSAGRMNLAVGETFALLERPGSDSCGLECGLLVPRA